MLFGGPVFWVYAYVRLPTSSLERAFLESTNKIVQEHKELGGKVR